MAAARDDAVSHRRIYARGMFDGLRMAGIDNPEGFLSAAKLERVERELSGIIKKVFDAVPAGEQWAPSQVLAEMQRQTGSRPEHRAVTACLGQLVERGLVKEPQRGMFMRAHVKPQLISIASPAVPAESVITPEQEAAMAVTASAKPAEAIDRLASLAATLKELSRKVAATAQEVEEVAMDVEGRIQRIHSETEKLRQLQALIKSIGQE